MKEIQPDTEISELIRCDMLRYPRKLDAGDDAYEK